MAHGRHARQSKVGFRCVARKMQTPCPRSDLVHHDTPVHKLIGVARASVMMLIDSNETSKLAHISSNLLTFPMALALGEKQLSNDLRDWRIVARAGGCF